MADSDPAPTGENQRTTAVGMFEDRRHAHLAVDELLGAGFTLEQIGFVMPDERPVVDPPQLRHHTLAEEGARRSGGRRSARRTGRAPP
ncbi:MAG: hypothetical protein U0736_16005 [Gemmataceae bacterium]